MTLQERIELLAELGDYLKNAKEDGQLDLAIRRSHLDNQWFTPENSWAALNAVAEKFLQKELLEEWAGLYQISKNAHPEKTVGIVMAGNIPLVGFHDWLCVFVAGYRAKIKLSDKDKHLLPFLTKKIGEWRHEAWEYTEFLTENDKLSGFDAVIATGSNNTSRYFEQYFGKHPHIIRRNRNSVAVLDGTETREELLALGEDIFSYFGLGCRNVSKLYLPRNFDFENLMETLHEFREIVLHNKYKNNFDYNFTLFILNKLAFKSNGCLLLREDPALTARIASANFEFYDSPEKLAMDLAEKKEEIQCVVGKKALPGIEVLPFGQSQKPGLSDYADGVDTLKFLTQNV